MSDGPLPSLSPHSACYADVKRRAMMAGAMCRNIKTLFNFDPPATDEEVRAASLQFVRKLSGFTKPSQANQQVFDSAVDEVAEVARRLIDSLDHDGPVAGPRRGRRTRPSSRCRALRPRRGFLKPRPRSSPATRVGGRPLR